MMSTSTTSGPVTIEDPFVRTSLPLPDTSHADLRVEVSLNNHESSPVSGTLRGRFGDVDFKQPVTLEAASSRRSRWTLRRTRRCGFRTRGCGGPPDTAIRISTTSNCSLRPAGKVSDSEVVPGRHTPVHLQRGGRRAEDLDQRQAPRVPRRQLGLPRDQICVTAGASTTSPSAITAT